MSGVPACTGSGESLFVTVTSATAVTWLVTEPVLLSRLGSPTSGDVTVAVFVRLPVVAIDGRTTTVTVADAPALSVPRLHDRLTVGPAVTPLGVHVPCDGVADWNPPVVTSEASASVTVTLVAAAGPWLSTVITYVRSCPAATGLGLAVLDTTRRSAAAVGSVEMTFTEPQLFAALPSDGPAPESATHAVLVVVPAAVATAGIVIVGKLLLAACVAVSVRVQVTVTGPGAGNGGVTGTVEHVQPVPVTAARSETPAGIVSVTVTVWPMATGDGPVLRTVTVYEKL